MKLSKPLSLLVGQPRPFHSLPSRFFASYRAQPTISAPHPPLLIKPAPALSWLQARHYSATAASSQTAADVLPNNSSTSAQEDSPLLRTPASNSQSNNHPSSSPSFSSSSTATFAADRPSYKLTFTCKPCSKRSSHSISKQGYHKGTVLITCPECKNRHVISDHLKIFSDLSFTIEDLMRDKGMLVKRGSIDGNGDVEFWDDNGKSTQQ